MISEDLNSVNKVINQTMSEVTIIGNQDSIITMHMVAPGQYFRELHRQFWEYRESHLYTDLLLVCQDGSIPAHSTVLAKLFLMSEIDFVLEDEPQLVLFPSCTVEQVKVALLETYACGSIEKFCELLCFQNPPRGRVKLRSDLNPEPNFEVELTNIGFDVKPDVEEEEDLLDLALKNLDEEDEEEEPDFHTRRRRRFPKNLPLEEKPFRCSECKYSANTLNKLELHSKARHLGLHKYTCVHCDFQANKKSDMKEHLRKMHSIGAEGRRIYSCSHCNQFEASSKKNLDLHIIETHKNVRKYHCDQCNYTSNYLNNFQRHQKAHQGIPGNYLCPHCPKAFYVEAKLRSHMLVHSDDKNFVCDECAAKFKRKDDLKVHMKIHLPDDVRAIEKAKKLTKVCETCGKKFEKNWKLKRHMVVHNKDSGLMEKTAPRWQSSKGISMPEYIVLTTDGKFLEDDKFITADRILVNEHKYLEAGESKYINAEGKCVTADRIVFNQIQYTDS